MRHLLYVLAGHGESITVEDVAELSEGVEFTYRRRSHVEVHQLKRQHGTINNWSVASLQALGIWRTAERHVRAGRHFHFVSTIPAQTQHELCDFARRSDNLDVFIQQWLLNEPIRKAFDQLSSPQLLGSPGAAWAVLRGTWLQWPDERDLADVNAALAELLLEGASGRLAAAGLADLVINNLGVELTASVVTGQLDRYGLRRATAIRGVALSDGVSAVTTNWTGSVDTELLDPPLPRDETADLDHLVRDQHDSLVLVIGSAGGGKTAVLRQAVLSAQSRGWSVLAFRLDRLETFASTEDLGTQLGFGVSPVAALAAAAGERPSILVVDQLDAVSLTSGRMPQQFDTIAGLIREATGFAAMRVVVACREFDAHNDERIRALAARSETRTLRVGPLSDLQVAFAVERMGLNASSLSAQQRQLLRTPLHLVLLATVATQATALTFQTSGHLFDAYWERKRRNVLARRAGARFAVVIATVASEMSKRQRLSVPITVLDQNDLANDADVLVSEHVLVRDRQQLAFFHETFFDYAFARHWVEQGQSLVAFLKSGEQELFRRAQVRQIMAHLREYDSDRFVDEVRQLLVDDDVRFHIKAAALAVLGSLSQPTVHEAELVLDIANEDPQYEARLWSLLKTSAWFSRFDADGLIMKWLQADEDKQHRALNLMGSAARTSPDRLANLLLQHQGAPSYGPWLRWCVRFAELATSRALFDLFLDAIRRGHYDGFEHEAWLSANDTAEHCPVWAVEVLDAFLQRWLSTLQLNDRGRIAVLESHDPHIVSLVEAAVTGAPLTFCQTLLPQLLAVMKGTAREYDGEGLRPDAHFSHRHPDSGLDTELGDVLFTSMSSALRRLTAEDPTGMRPTLEQLAADPHDSAQWLLYQAILGAGATIANWAAEILLEGRHRLLAGYSSNSVWTARQLLIAISPHVSNALFERLEEAIRDLRFPWERQQPGRYAFVLLTGLTEDRLSATGRRRLAELRRREGMDQPAEPEGIVSGWIGSPIPSDAARYMSDDNWLQAMVKHAGERTDFQTLTGGARELSRVLYDQVKEDPRRFARLALRFTADLNPAYGSALLMGIGDADPIEDDYLIYEAIRWIASLGHADNDRWLGKALRPYLKTAPLGIVELIKNRLMGSSESSDEEVELWSQGEPPRKLADLHMLGINTACGSLAEALADLLVLDVDGRRTSVVTPILGQLADESALPVRTCVADVISAAMRHGRSAATAAFWSLVDTDDALLATQQVVRLVIFLGNDEPAAVWPLIIRMLSSEDAAVRRAGGQLAALAAMEWGNEDAFTLLRTSVDGAVRTGAAEMAAYHLPRTANRTPAELLLKAAVADPDEAVRKAAAGVASALREQALAEFEELLVALVKSDAFAEALPQLMITLERAPDRVNSLVLLCAGRFVEIHGNEAADLRTSAAADARQVGQLIIRGLAQSRAADERAALLDALDQLLLTGAYGIDEVIGKSERQR